ncbi:hypothetical protein KAX17_14430 [Candidatus Bipolaricaulota bacterium]|nr:hypothetical protein [Candidatus Bipolaricaulota bacterium]
MVEEIQLFEIPKESAFPDAHSFRKHLSKSSVVKRALEHHDLYIAIALMGFEQPETLAQILVRNDFEVIAELGAVWHVRRVSQADTQERFEFYVTPDWESGVACFYTNYRKTEEMQRFLMPILLKATREPDIDSFVIYPSLIQRILDSVFDEHPFGKITEFTGRTTPGVATASTRRPDYKRTISYWGDDGRHAYPELHDLYGTAIVRAVVELPESGTKFKVSHEGVLAFCNGDLQIFFDVLDRFILPEANRQRRIVTRARTKYVSVGIAPRTRLVPLVFPMKIKLETPLEYHRAEKMIEGTFEENDFPTLSYFSSEGSLFLDAVLIDAKLQNRFRVKANEDWIKLLPGKFTKLATLLRFYQLVLNELDPHATLEVEE